LKDATSAKCENDDSPQNHGGQQSNRKRKLAIEYQEVDPNALQVLQDENEDYDQRSNSNDESSPGPAETRLPLARVGRRLSLKSTRRSSIHRDDCNAM